jgi:hypothetical protein
MSDSTSAFPLVDASGEGVLLDLSSRRVNRASSKPASPALPCALTSVLTSWWDIVPSFNYSPPAGGWTFKDPCPFARRILCRNAVCHGGELFELLSFSPQDRDCERYRISAVLISRNVDNIGPNGLAHCNHLQIVAFEGNSHLRRIGRGAFFCCPGIQSISLPSFVGLLEEGCFDRCHSLQSVVFEPPSRLETIEEDAFSGCRSLHGFVIPASVTAIHGAAFHQTEISSLEIEEGSVSFRVMDELLVDLEVRSLIWVIGSPESIVIPSSIEELRHSCCGFQGALSTVEFQAGSNLRSIGPSAFFGCFSLVSISIPSSVEILHNECFHFCRSLRRVTFGPESKLRLIDSFAFAGCPSVALVSVPTSAEVVGRWVIASPSVIAELALSSNS